MLFIKLNVVVSCFFFVGCSNQEVCLVMNASSNNSDVICPGQRFHLKCHTDSSFKGWYSSNDILFPLNDQQTTQNDSNYRAEYFPSRNLSILEVLHANKSFDVGCGSGPQNYTRNKFTVLQEHPEVSVVNCTYDVNNIYNINLEPPDTPLSLKNYSLTLLYEEGENTTSFFKIPNLVIRPNTTRLSNAEIVVTDICDRTSSTQLNFLSDCAADPEPTATTPTFNTKPTATTISSTTNNGIPISLLWTLLIFPMILFFHNIESFFF